MFHPSANSYSRKTGFAAKLVLALALVLGLQACAYRFGTLSKGLPGGYTQVAVPVFKNNTVDTGAEVFFTRSLIEEIERGKKAQVISKDQAEVILEGTLTSVQTIHGAQVTSGAPGFERLPERAVLTKEFRVLVYVDVQLKRKADEKILWKGAFIGEQRYASPQVTESSLNTANPLYNFSARYQTLRLIAVDMMQEAHDRLIENF
jgi:hypothetical protein